MIKLKDIETPTANWWMTALIGMRQSYDSTQMSDSTGCYGDVGCNGFYRSQCEICPYYRDSECFYDLGDGYDTIVIGENDLELFLRLCKEGTSQRKILRQLPVIMTIKAPQYFFRQLDTYKVGTTSNSSSQMHTLFLNKFTPEDFSLEKAEPLLKYDLISYLNKMRDLYLKAATEDDSEAMDKIWFEVFQRLPQSFNYTRTWSANYEVLVNIIKERIKHDLPEWRELIIEWFNRVPYLAEIMEAIGVIKIYNSFIYVTGEDNPLCRLEMY